MGLRYIADDDRSNGPHAAPHGLTLCSRADLWPVRADVIKVLDGDTVQLDVRLWPDLTQRINLRLVGVNTPEKRGPKVSDCKKKAGQDATTFTQRWLQGVKEVTISEVRHDKYAGRALGKLKKPDAKLPADDPVARQIAVFLKSVGLGL